MWDQLWDFTSNYWTTNWSFLNQQKIFFAPILDWILMDFYDFWFDSILNVNFMNLFIFEKGQKALIIVS